MRVLWVSKFNQIIYMERLYLLRFHEKNPNPKHDGLSTAPSPFPVATSPPIGGVCNQRIRKRNHVLHFGNLPSDLDSKSKIVESIYMSMLISVLLSLRFPSISHSSNEEVEVIPIDSGAIGPESFDFNPVDGTGPYTGVSDGRIIKWIASEQRWTDFAVTSPNRFLIR